MTAPLIARLAIVAALPLLFLSQLPSAAAIVGIALAGGLLLWMPRSPLRIAGVALLLAWMLGSARSGIDAVETASAVPAIYSVRIDEVRASRQQIKVQLIKKEGRYLFPLRFAWLTLREGEQHYCLGQR
ncbi:DNA internalization-related competence protein ComEC/Rec2|nr:DNA internalization-related competence protein ComEC/Rec2 [Candidatus Pantoea persica]